ncbi:MAG: LppX_LprAFG lipoprotein [Thermomicrobiales bacterium]|nr:LppX_LprAFG lipoprotein [Thermomicrobiales bacterium]
MTFTRRTVTSGALAAALLSLAGCGSEPEPPPTPESKTPEEILAAASSRLAETASVHFNLTVTGDTFVHSGKTIRLLGAEGDLVRPDRVQTTFQAEVVGRAVSLQLITIGDQSWTTNILTGEWGPAPLEFSYKPDILFSTQDGIGPVMGRVKGVARADDEQVDGRDAYHLTAGVDESIVGPLTYYTVTGSPVTVDLWIDRETNDLLRAQLAEPPREDAGDPAVWTLDLSHHGESIEIEPPI